MLAKVQFCIRNYKDVRLNPNKLYDLGRVTKIQPIRSKYLRIINLN